MRVFSLNMPLKIRFLSFSIPLKIRGIKGVMNVSQAFHTPSYLKRGNIETNLAVTKRIL
jgi:hypothetical protein